MEIDVHCDRLNKQHETLHA